MCSFGPVSSDICIVDVSVLSPDEEPEGDRDRVKDEVSWNTLYPATSESRSSGKMEDKSSVSLPPSDPLLLLLVDAIPSTTSLASSPCSLSCLIRLLRSRRSLTSRITGMSTIRAVPPMRTRVPTCLRSRLRLRLTLLTLSHDDGNRSDSPSPSWLAVGFQLTIVIMIGGREACCLLLAAC